MELVSNGFEEVLEFVVSILLYRVIMMLLLRESLVTCQIALLFRVDGS